MSPSHQQGDKANAAIQIPGPAHWGSIGYRAGAVAMLLYQEQHRASRDALSRLFCLSLNSIRVTLSWARAALWDLKK